MSCMTKKEAKEFILAHVVKQPDGCWEWQGRMRKGYGVVRFKHKDIGAHRLSWIVHKGSIASGLFMCHSCDNPICCNPNHLFPGTPGDNAADRHKKGRDASGQHNGNSKLSDKDVLDIRKRYDGRYGRLRELAREKNVTEAQIRNIIRGKQRMVGVAKVDWATSRLRRSSKDDYLGGKKTKARSAHIEAD